jgi:hypothetical protein
MTEMKKVWVKRATTLTKRTRKSKIPPLVVSEDHCAQILARYHTIGSPVRTVAYLLHSSGNESADSEPEVNDISDDSELESELDSQVGDGDASEKGEAENGMNGVSERENDPPFISIALTPVANVSDPEAVYHVLCVVLAEPSASTMSY